MDLFRAVTLYASQLAGSKLKKLRWNCYCQNCSLLCPRIYTALLLNKPSSYWTSHQSFECVSTSHTVLIYSARATMTVIAQRGCSVLFDGLNQMVSVWKTSNTREAKGDTYLIKSSRTPGISHTLYAPPCAWQLFFFASILCVDDLVFSGKIIGNYHSLLTEKIP